MVNQAQEKSGVTLVHFSLIADTGLISAIPRSQKWLLGSSLSPGHMPQDKPIFIDKLNKCIWELQILRNNIEKVRGLNDDQAHKAMDALNATRREIKSLSKELTAIYRHDLEWK